MAKERAKLFDDDDPVDVSQFAPKPGPAKDAPPAEEVRAVSEKANFPSRESGAATKDHPASSAKGGGKPLPDQKREQRRHRTGRNIQLNLKVTKEAYDLFYQITDAEDYVLGETFELAVMALQEKLARRKA